ncbi:MAG: DeoR/GlpR family DNA-binding transcription regulator [Microbacteriaceae bacterium]|jgi:DeoR/GlpR family transcriptional regulator of sugar metabolism|nr:DeoR/GlpR family DNA-binding transcription regulator [Microbacteriaceae bacterium]MCI1207565.1 DeoR/GlpR family DNA-binding transcription regulator [Microbacteriaceae bacterium]
MLASERRARILLMVNSRGVARVSELVKDLHVSDMTIRRDLVELHKQGLLLKVHGGATSLHSTSEPETSVKMSLHIEIKQRLAMAAAKRITDGESIALTAGSTCTYIAQEIAKDTVVTVVTNALRVSDEFYRNGSQVLLTGGTPTPSAALVGPLAVRSLEHLHVDTLFVGAHGVGAVGGLMTPNIDEARINQALLTTASHVVAVFDHTKWGISGLSTFATWKDIDTVITDTGLPPDALALLHDEVPEVVVVS